MIHPQFGVFLTPRPALFSRPMRDFPFFCMILALCGSVITAFPQEAQKPDPTASSAELAAALKRIKVAPGFRIAPFATEPMIQNPVSFAFDEKGRAYVVETHRRRTSVYDIRNHRDWLDDDFSFRTVADRSNFFRKVLVPDNPSLPPAIKVDRNKDGKFDSRDLEVESERIRLLEDTNNDSVADKATTYADGFNTLVSGVAAGVLARDGDVYFTCIPDLWKLRDTNNDGQADERTRLASGFGVHISFGGHDLHGLKIGPDGKLYFSIADRGLHVVQNGKTIAAPDTGSILRCNLDGSELELFATGLRNPQELAFDAYGNLWTGDNNGDGGDKARWLYVVEGGEYGWHLGWQHLPGMGPWNSELLWEMPDKNNVAYIIPPVGHIGHGPAGLTYYPGTGLPDAYRNHFFMCDFPGGVRTFTVRTRGAGFELAKEEPFLWELWPVDVDFGLDGGLYVLDWVQGWEKPGKGRLYRAFEPESAQQPILQEVRELLGGAIKSKNVDELGALLAHQDMRVRTEAHFALASRGLEATNVLMQVALNSPHDLARIHAIWGLGLVAKKHPLLYPDLLPLLEDVSNAEVRAQTVKLLGDARYVLAFPYLARAAADPNSRVRYFALLGLGKLRSAEAIEPILQVLRANRDNDPYLRHAAVMALTWINDVDALELAAKDSAPQARMAALLAMRRLGRPEIAMFLYDSRPELVLEATRGIYDEPITNAMSQLAAMINKGTGPAPAMRRVLHANYRLGNLENALSLSEFATKTNSPAELRAEAVNLLGQWGNSPKRDLLVGLWRPLPKREARAASLTLRGPAPTLVTKGPLEVRLAAIQAVRKLGLESVGGDLFKLFANLQEPAPLRLEALKTLAAFKHSKLGEAVKLALGDPHEAIRKEASTLEVQMQPGDRTTALLRMLENGALTEKQSALEMLATSENSTAVDPVLMMWMDRLLTRKAPRELELEILEAAQQRKDPLIQSQVKRYLDRRVQAEPVAQFSEALAGGDAEAGRKIFFERQDVQCLRCHKINGTGGEVGPDLTAIGSRANREHLLESMVAPNARMTPGYENLIIKLKNGESYIGLLKKEELEDIIIESPEDGLLKIPKASIESLDLGLSAMPADVTTMLTRRELRDLVEFLASQKAPQKSASN